MKEIIENLYVGTVSELPALLSDVDNWKIVNLSSKWHKEYHHWEEMGADRNSPYYVIHEESDFISLNWVDAAAMYFDYQGQGVSNCFRVLTFIKTALKENKKVFICCDQAQSRAPSIALLFLATTDRINNTSFENAKKDFMYKYPEYKPSSGIQEFITKHWQEFTWVTT